MTASFSSARNPMAATTSPLMFGVGGYAALMRRQFETTMSLTSAWTTAMSAVTSTLLARTATGAWAVDEEVGGAVTSPRLRAVPTDGASIEDGHATIPAQPERHHGQPGGRMLGWLTTTPTLHPDLFDEAMVLLVDEDIKTAS